MAGGSTEFDNEARSDRLLCFERKMRTWWNPLGWSRREALDYAEFLFIALATGLAAVAGVVDAVAKAPWAIAAAVSGLLAAGSKFWGKKLDERSKRLAASQLQRTIRAALGHMHGHFFEQQDPEDLHKHRITLFVCRSGQGGPLGCKRWLAIYARKGAHPESTTVWPVDDDQPDKCTGLVGKIWAYGGVRFDEAACSWPTDGNETAKRTYSDSQGITVAEAERLNVKARYFAGSDVMVRGAKWGVLFIDSLKEFRLAEKGGHLTRQKKRLERYATLVGKLLEEGEQ